MSGHGEEKQTAKQGSWSPQHRAGGRACSAGFAPRIRGHPGLGGSGVFGFDSCWGASGWGQGWEAAWLSLLSVSLSAAGCWGSGAVLVVTGKPLRPSRAGWWQRNGAERARCLPGRFLFAGCRALGFFQGDAAPALGEQRAPRGRRSRPRWDGRGAELLGIAVPPRVAHGLCGRTLRPTRS